MFLKHKIILISLIVFLAIGNNSPKAKAIDTIIEIDNNFKKFEINPEEENPQSQSRIKKNYSKSNIEEQNKNKIIQQIKSEPSYKEVLNATLRFYAIPSAKDFKNYRKQARARNLLPEINTDIDYAKNRDWDYGIDSVNPNNTAVWGGGGNLTYNHTDRDLSRFYSRDLSFGLSGQWHLNDVLYDDEVTDIISEQRRFATIKNDLIEQTHSAYYERRRKQIIYAVVPAKDKYEEILHEIEIAELTSKLDSLTGGWFTRELVKRNTYEFSFL